MMTLTQVLNGEHILLDQDLNVFVDTKLLLLRDSESRELKLKTKHAGDAIVLKEMYDELRSKGVNARLISSTDGWVFLQLDAAALLSVAPAEAKS